MIRRLLIVDFLTFAPALFFASVGEILKWVAITLGVGLLIALFCISQIRSIFRAMADHNNAANVKSLPVLLLPGLAGLLLILPGLLSDLLAGVILLVTCVSLFRRKPAYREKAQTWQAGAGRQDDTKKQNKRVIVVDYDTIDEEDTDGKKKRD